MSDPEPEQPNNRAPRPPTFFIEFMIAFACMFLLAAPVVGFNLGGVAEGMGIEDEYRQGAIGIMCLVTGVLNLLGVGWLHLLLKKKP